MRSEQRAKELWENHTPRGWEEVIGGVCIFSPAPFHPVSLPTYHNTIVTSLISVGFLRPSKMWLYALLIQSHFLLLPSLVRSFPHKLSIDPYTCSLGYLFPFPVSVFTLYSWQHQHNANPDGGGFRWTFYITARIFLKKSLHSFSPNFLSIKESEPKKWSRKFQYPLYFMSFRSFSQLFFTHQR